LLRRFFIDDLLIIISSQQDNDSFLSNRNVTTKTPASPILQDIFDTFSQTSDTSDRDPLYLYPNSADKDDIMMDRNKHNKHGMTGCKEVTEVPFRLKDPEKVGFYHSYVVSMNYENYQS